MPSQKAVIIGAGIGGIATAVRLAVKGFSVEVYESNSYPGGKLSEIRRAGFRFDAGPSLLTMPQYIDELFILAGRDPRDHFQYQRLAVNCKYFYPDGKQLTAFANKEKFKAEVAALYGGGAAAIEKYIANSARIYAITSRVFLESSLHRLATYCRWSTLKSAWQLFKIDAFRTMHQANKRFFADSRIVQLYDRYATYNGSNPYQAPATLNVIPHLEEHFGAYFPTNGMYTITTALVELAASLGVKFIYNSTVDRIVLNGKKAIGVSVNNAVIHADVIVSNMDVRFTYHKLLKQYPELYPKKILNQERSSSALIFYWGIKKQFPALNLHNIFFSKDYRDEFDAIWKQQSISADPTVYINISSKLKTDDAPPGCENWFVMINTPANTGQDWEQLTRLARKNIIAKLSSALGEDVGRLITVEQVLDPQSIEAKTSSYQGSLYGNSSNSRNAAFLRHANKSSKISGLYFCGGSVHPGGGIPLALLSARIVGEWVK